VVGIVYCLASSWVRMNNPQINKRVPITCIGITVSPRRYHARIDVKNGDDNSVRATWLDFVLFNPS